MSDDGPVAIGRLLTEDFDGLPIGSWKQGSTSGNWCVEWAGVNGQVAIVDVSGKKVLRLHTPELPGDTTSGLVVSKRLIRGNFDLIVDMRTLAQSRDANSNPWEVAWFVWHFRRLGDHRVRFYYVALKPSAGGLELGKVDQSAFVDTGGQRFLPTLSTGNLFPVGAAWYKLRITQTEARIEVWVDGTKEADVIDGSGSGGTPAFGWPGETVFTEGQFGFYHEDADVEFRNLRVSAQAPR